MSSRRCNLRTINGKAHPRPEGLSEGRVGPPSADKFLGDRVRKLHLRVFTIPASRNCLPAGPSVSTTLGTDARNQVGASLPRHVAA